MKKKLLAMALILVMMFALMPTGTQAAEAVPKKVTTAMKRAVTENGRVIVVDNANSKVYLFKDGKLKKSFRCTVGDYINPKKHYHLLRNGDTDKAFYYEGGKMFSYGIGIDCYEEAPVRMLRFHSYGEKGGKTYKSVKHNPNGIGMCIDNAYYIWRYYGNGTAVMGVD